MLRYNISPSAVRRFRNSHHKINKMKSSIKLFFLFLVSSAVLLVLVPRICDIRIKQFPRAELLNLNSNESPGNTECRFPQLDPFDSSIQQFINETIKLNCQRQYPLLFHTNSSHLITIVKPEQYGLSECCYRNLIRYRGSDNSIGLSRRCTKISNNTTAVPLPSYIEFISISCKSQKSGKHFYVDMLSLVPYKPEVNLKIELLQRKLSRQKHSKYFSLFRPSKLNSPRVNVLMLGLDSVSHMNFLRTMPRSINFLEEIGSSSSSVVVGMNGYTKIGDNTYPNAIGFLSGLNVSQFESKCNLPFYDECPFIWNSFSSQAYVTSFGEDAPGMSIFNFQKHGFNNSPVDYYLRPLTFTQDKFIGNTESTNCNLCYGPRNGFQVLVDYTMKMADTMQTNMKNYFQLIWATSLFHDSNRLANNGDETLEMFLRFMADKEYLENTALVLLSDHGMRWGPLRQTWQGKIEEKMPFLYFILPKWMETDFPKAIANLRDNAERLTTPYDLHETLQDFLHLTNIRDDQLTTRSEKVSSEPAVRGTSLFLPIPVTRRCQDASIPFHYCVCDPSERISTEDVSAKDSSEVALVQINDILSQANYCAQLSMGEIVSAEKVVKSPGGKASETLIDVGFRTVPGDATFEATVRSVGGRFTVLGDISRTNEYGNQSWCVSSSELKKFCYCLS